MSNQRASIEAPSPTAVRNVPLRRMSPPDVRRDDGFTLLELMVVVLVVGVLVAIALPTFLGARQRAADTAAKSSLRHGLTVGRIVYTTERTYDVDIEALRDTDGSLRWEDTGDPSTGAASISADPVDADTLVMAVYSASGTCFYMQDDAPDRTRYAARTDTTSATCTAGNTGDLTFSLAW